MRHERIGRQFEVDACWLPCTSLGGITSKNLRKVSLWLGHADMQTTMTYLRTAPSEKIATVTAVVPMETRRARIRTPDRLIVSLHSR
jgi:integrase